MRNELHFSEQEDSRLIDSVEAERSEIGFYNLPDQDITLYKDFAKNVKANDIVIIGIGGSSLGTEAIYQFLKSSNRYDKKLHFLDTTDPLTIEAKLSDIDLQTALFIVISKSGTTVESISIFKYLLNIIPLSSERYLIITDSGSPLQKFGEENDLTIFTIPDNVGGRYSVLSAVGLVPLSIIGADIEALLKGAKRLRDEFFNREISHSLLQKATFYARNSEKYTSNCLFSYSAIFEKFNSWYVQLWGESLGKKQLHSNLNVGLTPIGLIGPTDQHSFLQLIMEGKSDKSVTVIKIKNFGTDMQIPDISLPHLQNLDNLNKMEFSQLINMQCDSTVEALDKIGVPVDLIEIEKVHEESIGQLMYYYELLTAVVAKQLDINAYDQPGVELGKKILKSKMANGG
jgi:glucose-6-phosphate isomerase